MLSNYLKVGIRNILKYKVYSSINAGGLALGIAASVLIILYIADELSYDRFLKDSEQIYRIGPVEVLKVVRLSQRFHRRLLLLRFFRKYQK